MVIIKANTEIIKRENEDFILNTLTEISYIPNLRMEMVKIRFSFINESGDRRDKLILTSPLVSVSDFPLLIKELYSRCEYYKIDLTRVFKIHLHLILYYK
jgi:hypothetical protein